jgi:hypothetical protein
MDGVRGSARSMGAENEALSNRGEDVTFYVGSFCSSSSSSGGGGGRQRCTSYIYICLFWSIQLTSLEW